MSNVLQSGGSIPVPSIFGLPVLTKTLLESEIPIIKSYIKEYSCYIYIYIYIYILLLLLLLLLKGTTTKIISRGGGFFSSLRPLMTADLPLMKGALTPLAKIVLFSLGLLARMSAEDAAIQKKI